MDGFLSQTGLPGIALNYHCSLLFKGKRWRNYRYIVMVVLNSNSLVGIFSVVNSNKLLYVTASACGEL